MELLPDPHKYKQISPISIISATNQVPMAHHGLILGEDRATASGKLFNASQARFRPSGAPTNQKKKTAFLRKPAQRGSQVQFEPASAQDYYG